MGTEEKKKQLEDFMIEIDDAKQGYKDQLWSGEECLSMLWCYCKVRLDKIKEEE